MKDKNKIIKNEKGAITLFVLVVCIFFTFLMVGAYNKTINRLHVQEQEVQQIHDNYLRSVEMADEIYKATATVKVSLVRGENSTGSWIDSVELIGTGQVSSSTLQIVEYSFAKEEVPEENLIFTSITPTSSTQQKTIVTESGTYYFYVKDNNGDIHRSNKVEIFDIDSSGPIVGTLIAKKNTSTGETYTYDTWTSTNVYIEKVNGSDPESGHKRTSYTVKKDNILYYDDIEEPKILTEDGVYTVVVTTENNAGIKVSGEPYIIKISRSVPILTLRHNTSTGATYTSGTWTKDDLYGEITIDTSVTGKTVSKFQYSYDGNTWYDVSATQATNGIKYYNYNKSGNTVTFMLKDQMNKEIMVRAVYTDGEISATSSTTSIKIDKTAPQVGSVVANGYTFGKWINKDVSISKIDGTDNESGHKKTTYTVKQGSTTLYSNIENSVTLNDTGTYTITVTTEDIAGNTSTSSEYTVRIDRVEPAVGKLVFKKNNSTGPIYNLNEWTGTDVYVEKQDGTDNESGHYKTSYNILSLTGGSFQTATGVTDPTTLIEHGQYYLLLTTEDNAGNVSTQIYSSVLIDKKAPTIELGEWSDPIKGSDGKIHRTITIYYSDIGSGLARKYYLSNSLSDAPTASSTWKSIDNDDIILEDKVYYIWTIDNVGNISNWKKLDATNVIDNTPPTVGTLIGRKNNSSGELYTFDTWTNTNVYLEKRDGSDSGSGHYRTTYSVYKVGTTSSQLIYDNIENPVTLTEDGVYAAYVITTDNMGNQSISDAYVIRIDKTPPTITLGQWSEPIQTSDGKIHRTIKITYTDKGSGIKGRYISTSSTPPTASSSWEDAGTDVTFESGKTYYLWAIDNVGNISAMTTIKAP